MAARGAATLRPRPVARSRRSTRIDLECRVPNSHDRLAVVERADLLLRRESMNRTAAGGCAGITALGLAVHPEGLQDTSGSQSAAGTYTGGNPATYITAPEVQAFLKALPKDTITSWVIASGH